MNSCDKCGRPRMVVGTFCIGIFENGSDRTEFNRFRRVELCADCATATGRVVAATYEGMPPDYSRGLRPPPWRSFITLLIQIVILFLLAVGWTWLQHHWKN